MKRIYFSLVILCLLAVWCGLSFQTNAQIEDNQAQSANLVSPSIVISQFQVAGDSTNAALDEFIELHNISSAAIDLNGFRAVYRSAAGTNDVALVEWNSATIIPAGGYYLIATSSYNGSVPSNINYNTSMVSMSGTGGGLAIRNGALNSGIIFDSVGYGTATNTFIEGTRTTAPSANAGQARVNNACQDTDNNAADFSTLNPSAPRNTSSPINICNGGGTSLLAGGGASPSTLVPGAATLLTVNVFPATTPPSTGISVTGNLASIGGAANQPFYDDGTHGDVTAGDNIFSYSVTISANTVGGIYTVTATASDAQSRTANVSIDITVNAPIAGEDHLLLGNPSNATSDVANENNYLLTKPQYALSYNRSRATANWVSWHLDSSWLGNAPRQDDFRPDDTLPANWYHVMDSDYSGTGETYNRGHMTPSSDRTRSIPDNSATFLMTNIVPQFAANNQGAWEDFETYLRSLVQSGQEIYIISGVSGNIGTIGNGKIVIPQYTWKVALVLPNGTNDLQRITKGTRTIAIIVPNFPPLNINATWRQFRVSVNEVENLTGYNFFTNVPKNTQELIEKRKDRQ